MAVSRARSSCRSGSMPIKSRRISITASWKSSCNGWKRTGRRRSKSALHNPSGGNAIMAQEVRTIDQRTPPTTRGHRDRIPSRPVFVPPSDIYETKDSIVVLAEMPGVAPDGVDITLERRVLTIRGRSAASEHAGYQRVYNEYRQRGLRARLHAFRKHRPRPDRGDGSRTASCSSSCQRRKPQRLERSSSKRRERRTRLV